MRASLRMGFGYAPKPKLAAAVMTSGITIQGTSETFSWTEAGTSKYAL